MNLCTTPKENKLHTTIAHLGALHENFNCARPISMSVFVALGTTASQGKEQEPETPVNRNPLIVTPVKPDPEKPDPEKPDPEKPDPEKPVSVELDPEKPNPKPDYPEIDYDNLTEAQQKEAVAKVLNALTTNIKKAFPSKIIK